MDTYALVQDKTKQFTRWSDWLRDAKSKMAALSITSNSHMFVYIKSQACTEVKARLEGLPANQVLGTNTLDAYTLNNLIEKTEKVLLKVVNRDQAVIYLRSHRATIPS